MSFYAERRASAGAGVIGDPLHTLGRAWHSPLIFEPTGIRPGLESIPNLVNWGNYPLFFLFIAKPSYLFIVQVDLRDIV